MAERDGGLLQRGALLVRLLRDLGRLVVADVRVEAGDEHERVLQVALDHRAVRLDALGALVVEAHAGIADQAGALQHIGGDQRLEHVELEVAVARADAHGHIIAHHLGGHHGERLGLRGVHLAGHDAGAGLVVRDHDLTDAAARPAAEHADVVADLHEGDRETLQRAAQFHHGIVGGERLELVGRGDEGQARELGDLLRHSPGRCKRNTTNRIGHLHHAWKYCESFY